MPLHCTRPGGDIALLTLDDAKARNALTAEMRSQLRETLETLALDRDIRAVVITGAGGNFCAGGDVRTMGETDVQVIDRRMNEVADAALTVAAFPKPLIAAVSGHAAGAGVSLSCLSDMVVADGTAQFTFSHLKVGLGPDWGLSFTLPRRVGVAAARRLILARETLSAAEAHRLGLVDVLAPDGEAEAMALDRARNFALGPPEGAAMVKGNFADLDGLKAALKLEGAQQRERFLTAEHREGVAAFRERRPPNFGKDGG